MEIRFPRNLTTFPFKTLITLKLSLKIFRGCGISFYFRIDLELGRFDSKNKISCWKNGLFGQNLVVVPG